MASERVERWSRNVRVIHLFDVIQLKDDILAQMPYHLILQVGSGGIGVSGGTNSVSV